MLCVLPTIGGIDAHSLHCINDSERWVRGRKRGRKGRRMRIGGKEEVTQKIGREGKWRQRGSWRLEMLKGREPEQIVQFGTARTVQYSTIQSNTIRYSTVQYSTVQNGTARTVQYSTVQYTECSTYEVLGPAAPHFSASISAHRIRHAEGERQEEGSVSRRECMREEDAGTGAGALR